MKYAVVCAQGGRSVVVSEHRRLAGARAVRDERVTSEARASRKHAAPGGRIVVGPTSDEGYAVVMLDARSRVERITIFDVREVPVYKLDRRGIVVSDTAVEDSPS